jgi:hypothetical protein
VNDSCRTTILRGSVWHHKAGKKRKFIPIFPERLDPGAWQPTVRFDEWLEDVPFLQFALVHEPFSLFLELAFKNFPGQVARECFDIPVGDGFCLLHLIKQLLQPLLVVDEGMPPMRKGPEVNPQEKLGSGFGE